ncbi:MAG: choice-of-anchor D domain-containing protein [Myxococcales bacterium]
MSKRSPFVLGAVAALLLTAGCNGGEAPPPDGGAGADASQPAGLDAAAAAPVASVEPSSLDFGTVLIGEARTLQLTVRNVGAEGSRLQVVAGLAAGSSRDFVVDWPAGAPTSGIAAGQSAVADVTFRPTTTGARGATVLLSSNDPAQGLLQVEVSGAGAGETRCVYDVEPPLLTVGLVEPEVTLQLSFSIRNRGQVPCEITDLRVAETAPVGFELVNGPIASATIAAGEQLDVPVRACGGPRGFRGVVVQFEVANSAQPHGQWELALSGTNPVGCLLIAPSELDFGAIGIGCQSRPRTFTLYNVCAAAQTVTSIALASGSSPQFEVVSTPTFPYTLSAGASVDFKVQYSPVDHGEDRAALAVSTSRPEPYLVWVVGRGKERPLMTDLFWMDPAQKVDILFVIDDSSSMAERKQDLHDSLGNFYDYIAASSRDFQLAVTTTGVDLAHGGLSDPATPAANGCLLPLDGSRPKVVTSRTLHARETFLENAEVGIEGSEDELLLRPAVLAFSEPNLSGCNAGFLRDEAILAVILISDALDTDPEAVVTYVNALYGVKGFHRMNQISFSAIYSRGLQTDQCHPEAGGVVDPRVGQMVTSTGGVSEDICTEDWEHTFEAMGELAFGYRTRFFLSSTADPTYPVTLKVNGVDVPPTGAFGACWTFNASSNAIDFELHCVPEPESNIEVTYRVACGP